MKRLNVTVQCMAVYNSSIEVPDNMTLEEAIEYAKKHLAEIPCGELEYISDSDELDEEGDYFNGWGVTDNYNSDYPIGLTLGIDFVESK